MQNINENEDNDKILKITEKNKKIKKFQDDYADSYSKNQNIKKDSIKRNERIKTIETEVISWKNLLSNSEKMITELNERKKKIKPKTC